MRRLFTIAAILLFAATAQAADWPQWLGPERNGVSGDTGLMQSWPATGPVVQWRVPLGKGFSGISIADGHLIILGEIGNLGIAEATPDAFRAKATHPVFDSKCWTNPSLADGRIYLRDEKKIVCLNINQ